MSSAIAPATELSTDARSETHGRWLFSRNVDLSAFAGSAALSILLLLLGRQAGLLDREMPAGLWIVAVLLVDVAHVHATWFRVYLDSAEFKRRALLYSLVPLLGYLIGVLLYLQGAQMFWRVLAYIAVFHFVRQQYGWVSLYRAKSGETAAQPGWSIGYCIDASAIYLCAIYPLVYWHLHLPRKFWWFVTDDFSPVHFVSEKLVFAAYVLALSAYAARTLYRWLALGLTNPGKDIVVAATALCWYLGIVAFNSDYAFTVTNIFIHGIPYLVLVYWYTAARRAQVATSGLHKWLTRGPVVMLLTVWLLAYFEEMIWHRGVWHEHGALFGSYWDWASLRVWLVPLLALPQMTHYVLDGFIWRRRSNPDFDLVR